jgi:hypothetical protein
MMTDNRPNLLHNPLAVISAAAVSFLVVLTLLTGRVVSRSDPALRAGASNQVLALHRGHMVLRTTASGRVLGGATPGTGVESGGAQPAMVVTRTNGGPAGGGERDG